MNPLTEQDVRQIIKEELAILISSDRFTFQKKIQIFDGRHIQLGKTTGTKIGTETAQKLGFFNTAPVIQASAIGAPSSPSAAYSQSEAQSAVNAINSLRTAVKNIGITA